jgi:hypothetical protein
MDDATRTTEGFPSRCPVCGKRMSIDSGEPVGDAVCPHCGVLFYPEWEQARPAHDDLQRLADLGVIVETDDEGEVTRLQFQGPLYNDHTIPQLAKLKGVPVIDIRKTKITPSGADRLRALLPDAIIEN